MKILLISDIHLGKIKDEEFLTSQFNFLKNDMVQYAVSNDIKNIFIIGDLYDNRNNLNVMIKNESMKIFEDLSKLFNIYILVGNHDSYYTNTIETNSVKFLSKFNNINVIESNTLIELDNKKIYLVPWIVDQSSFIEDSTVADVCLGHFDIIGAKYNKSVKSENGFDKNVFYNYKKVFTGHYHTRSALSFNETEIVYIGAPFQFDKGDSYEERGFVTLDLNDLSYEYVNNKSMIRHIQINIDDEVTKEMMENAIVDINIDASLKLTDKEIQKHIENISKLNPKEIGNITILNKEVIQSNFKLEQTTNTETIIENYIYNSNIDRKEDLNIYMKSLFNAASE